MYVEAWKCIMYVCVFTCMVDVDMNAFVLKMRNPKMPDCHLNAVDPLISIFYSECSHILN